MAQRHVFVTAERLFLQEPVSAGNPFAIRAAAHDDSRIPSLGELVMIRSLSLAPIAFALTALLASAQQPDLFTRLDTNKDGKVSMGLILILGLLGEYDLTHCNI